MPVVLPSQYRFAHDYAVFLHDLIAGKLKGGLDAEIFKTTIPLTEADAKEFAELQGEDLYRWLEENVEPEVLLEADYKMLVQALIADFCHYVLEALNASRKGKLTVAFTLLRKPFQDSLFYLEWMLADLPDFFDRFKNGSAKDLEVKALPVERRKEIIREAIAALPDPHTINPEFIYDVRYNRAEPYSLAGLSDQAVHLVTTNVHLLTAPQNFNFIFSNPEQFQSQWHHIYLVIPQLLYHAERVISQIISGVAKWDSGWETWIQVRRDIGLLLYMDSVVQSAPERIDVARESLGALLAALTAGCPQCGKPLALHLRNMRQFCVRGAVRCTTCRDTIQFEINSA